MEGEDLNKIGSKFRSFSSRMLYIFMRKNKEICYIYIIYFIGINNVFQQIFLMISLVFNYLFEKNFFSRYEMSKIYLYIFFINI